ncbi:MAG: type II secretion system F family protein [Lachnospiraceae bacterium]
MKNQKALSFLELSAFCSQIAMLLDSGVSISQGIEIMLEELKDENETNILVSIGEALDQGENFNSALEMSGVFPNHMIEMVKVGELSGNLDNVMENLAIYYQNENTIKENVKSAVRYPLVMIGMMGTVIFIIITQVMPVFAQVYSQLGSQMSVVSQGIVNMGNTFSKYSVLIFGVILLLVFLYLYMSYTSKGAKLAKAFLSKFFLTKHIYEKVSKANFANGLALMLHSGIDTSESIEKVLPLIEEREIYKKASRTKQLLEEGMSFEKAISESELFTPLHSKLIAIASKTGNTDKIMQQIAQEYNNQANDEIYKLISLIEPCMVAIFSIIIGIVLLSAILPLAGVLSSIG